MADPKQPRPGGAERARLKRQRLEAEAAARASTAGETYGAAYYRAELEPPPADAVGTIAYANRAAGLLLHNVLTDDAITSETERRKLARELIAVIGMTHSKALYEERLKKLESKVGVGSEGRGHDVGEKIPEAGGAALRARAKPQR